MEAACAQDPCLVQRVRLSDRNRRRLPIERSRLRPLHLLQRSGTAGNPTSRWKRPALRIRAWYNEFDCQIGIDGAFRSSDRAFGRYTFYNEVEQPVTPLPDGSGLLSGSVLGTTSSIVSITRPPQQPGRSDSLGRTGVTPQRK